MRTETMKKTFLFIAFFMPCLAFAQFTATYEEIYTISVNYAKKYLNTQNPNVTVANQATTSRPLYEINIGIGKTLIVSSEKYALPVLAVVENDEQIPILGNPDLPDGLQYFIDKYCSQILSAMSNRDNSIHTQWEELLDNEDFSENNSNRTIYGPFLTTAWGQESPNYGYAGGAAYNYFVEETSNDCSGGEFENKCYTGCVATAMAQIMKYWNYPVFRAGKNTQYDWCNMPDSLNYYFPPTVMLNPNYVKQRNAIAKLMADCGKAANMHYCCHGVPFQCGCQSFAWPVDARNALVDSFQYNSAAARRLRSSFSARKWKDSLLLDIQNGRPVLYAGASYATGGYEQGGHAFVCDGYNEGTDLFHFNWGWNGSYNNTWCALDAIVVDDYNFNHFERAVFHIYPSTNENYCDFDLELWMHYFLFYNPSQTTPPPYQNVPPIATRLYSVPVSLPSGSGNYYFDSSWRTIPSGAISEYVAHKEVVLRPGFTAENGCDFVARIDPCAECEEERGQNHPTQVANVTPRRDVARNITPTPNTLRLHPNPTGSTLTVESASPIREITVYDLSGRVMMTANGGIVETCHGASLQMDVSSLQGGIYLLRVVTENGVETGRFVKN